MANYKFIHRFDRMVMTSALPIPQKKRRDFSTIAKVVPTLPFDEFMNPTPSVSLDLRQFEDRRLFHPEGAYAPARSTGFRAATEIDVYSPGKKGNRVQSSARVASGPVSTIGFQDASRVVVCLRRRAREEVMHALGHAGKRGQKAPRRSSYSDILC